MPDALMLAVALLLASAGLGWLALAMNPHWSQVRGEASPGPRTVRMLRVLGTAALLLSLGACRVADHASMAALVWVMALAGAAMGVAFTLSWRPRWLAPLVIWVQPGAN